MILSSILVEIVNWIILILGIIYVVGYGLLLFFKPDLFDDMRTPWG